MKNQQLALYFSAKCVLVSILYKRVHFELRNITQKTTSVVNTSHRLWWFLGSSTKMLPQYGIITEISLNKCNVNFAK